MKQLIPGAIIACMALMPSFGWQRGSGGASSVPWVSGRSRGFDCRNFGGGRNPFWGAAPWSYGENDYDDGWPPDFSDKGSQAPAPAGPQVIVPEAPPPPPEPVRPVIREYIWPEPSGRAVSFSIVSKDGTVRSAIAVWVQAGVLHFTAPDKTAGQIPLNTVDRRATAQLNAEKSLRLTLP